MLAFHPSLNIQKINKINNWNSQPLVLSSRPKIQQLPFLNNLKQIRKLLVNIKNDKLRKSVYSVTRQKQINNTNHLIDNYTHQKGKLSVMDLISQEGKFQELSNTIQNNLNKKSIQLNENGGNQDQNLRTKQIKKFQQFQSNKQQDIQVIRLDQQNKQVKKEVHKVSPVLNKKNLLAQQLNKLGHQLEQTYFQVQQMQKVFSILCQYYSQHKKTIDQNLKMKQKKQLIKQKIQQYKEKIHKNENKMNEIDQKKSQFLEWYKKAISEYIMNVVQYNSFINNKLSFIEEHHQNNQKCYQEFMQYNAQSKVSQNSKQNRKDLQQHSSDQQQNKNNQVNKINLKFKLLKGELQKIKLQKKNSIKQKNKEKKSKNQNNNFTKFYASDIYTL